LSPEDPRALDLRERLTEAAYPLFARRGIRDVSLEEIEEAAGLGSEQHGLGYASRDEAAADFLARRERDWTIGTIEAGARRRGATPELRLLAIFDVFDDWFHRDDFEACCFINVMIEMGATHPLGQASIEYLVHIRQIVTTLAEEAHLRDPAEFARCWHILMKGSIISATEGDTLAARRAQRMARALIREHAPIGSEVSRVNHHSGGSIEEETVVEWSEWDDLFGRTGGSTEVTGASGGSYDAFDYEYDLR